MVAFRTQQVHHMMEVNACVCKTVGGRVKRQQVHIKYLGATRLMISPFDDVKKTMGSNIRQPPCFCHYVMDSWSSR